MRVGLCEKTSMNRVRISAFRPGRGPDVNDWWATHLGNYLRLRGFEFTRVEPVNIAGYPVFDVQIRNPDEDFRIRLIADRYGQSTIGIHSEDGLSWVKP